MRIAICTRLRIPIFICKRENSSSFASCGMRQLCADAEDVALVWQNEHRHAVKTTESGHKRSSHTQWEGESSRPSWFVSFEVLSSKKLSTPLIWSVAFFFFPSFEVKSLSVDTNQHTHKRTRWNVIEAHIEGVDGRRFFVVFFSWSYNPVMRKKTYSTGCEKGAGPGSHTFIHMSLSGLKQHHRTEICHRSWAPSTPNIDIH